MNLESWLAWATGEAERRNLPDLVPLVESLARSTRALRAADWNEEEPEKARGSGLTARGPVASRD